MRRSILADSNRLAFLMTPENSLPCYAYMGEHNPNPEYKDPYLLSLIDELEELRDLPDVRPKLEKQYKIRSLLKNAKLI